MVDRHRVGLAIAALSAVALGSVGCSSASAPQDGSAVVIENQEANPVEIQVEGIPGYYSGFLIPANAWAALPGAWATVYRVSSDCTTVSAQGVYPIRPYHIITLYDGSLGDYGPLDDHDPVISQPTLGPLSSTIPSTRCPNGPHNPPSE
jgi:hypothetical protein